MNLCKTCGTICPFDDERTECDAYAPMTNELWFENLTTEEKARFFSHEMRCEFCPNQEQCDSLGANCKVLWELWLKKPHKDTNKAEGE